MLLSLLTLLPVFLLFLTALVIILQRQSRPSIGYAWLIGALGGLLTVGAMLFLRWQIPLQITAEQWRPFGIFSSPPVFRLDLNSWPYGFGLVVLALSFIFTDSARLETEARPLNWAAGLSITGVGVLAVMAASPVTLVLTWTAVDLLELIMVLFTDAGRRMGQQTVTAFSVRVAGTLLVMLAIFVARSQGLPFDLDPIPSSLAIFMLLASGLRLGVLPLNLPYVREVYAWRGMGNVLRLVGPASALVVLGRMPEQAVPESLQPVFLMFAALAAVFGGVMWLTADNEIYGRPYWSTAMAALAVASVVNGQPAASVAWGTTLLLSGSVLFFYSARRRRNLILPSLAMVGMVGLPFTPTAVGWLGLAGSNQQIFIFVFLISYVLLLWGYVRHSLRPREELHRMERWVHTIYPTGLLFLIIAHWVVGVLGWPGSLVSGVWWASVSVALVAGLGIVLAIFFRERIQEREITYRWIGVVFRQVGGLLGVFFRLNWLYRFLSWVYQVMQNIAQLITAMFEGDGGILWSLVMLALLVSLILTTGGQ